MQIESQTVSSEARFRRIVPLHEARPDLPERTLFHAGPPYDGERPAAVITAAKQAAVLSGWADDLDKAAELLDADEIRLKPAQDHGFAVPLAMVLAPSMWCVEVGDASTVFYAAMSEGPAPALRFGSKAPESRERASEWCARAAAAINPRLGDLPTIKNLIDAALASGDECHAVTASGNQLLVDALGDIAAPLRSDLLGNPSFVLSIWMAWAGWKLRGCKSAIEAIGGNGVRFGWRARGTKEWHTVAALCPAGTIFKHDRADYGLGAIGDSAVVDICGLGGQALRHAPKLQEEWARVLPADLKTRHERILDRKTGIVNPDRVIETGAGPIINLAIVDRDSSGFPIGRGVFIVPPELFNTGT